MDDAERANQARERVLNDLASVTAAAREGIAALKSGVPCVKHGRSGKPHAVVISLSADARILGWQRHGLGKLKRKSEQRAVRIDSLLELLVGFETRVLQRAVTQTSDVAVHRALSLLLPAALPPTPAAIDAPRQPSSSRLSAAVRLTGAASTRAPREARESLDLTFADDETFGYVVAALRALMAASRLPPSARSSDRAVSLPARPPSSPPPTAPPQPTASTGAEHGAPLANPPAPAPAQEAPQTPSPRALPLSAREEDLPPTPDVPAPQPPGDGIGVVDAQLAGLDAEALPTNTATAVPAAAANPFGADAGAASEDDQRGANPFGDPVNAADAGAANPFDDCTAAISSANPFADDASSVSPFGRAGSSGIGDPFADMPAGPACANPFDDETVGCADADGLALDVEALFRTHSLRALEGDAEALSRMQSALAEEIFGSAAGQTAAEDATAGGAYLGVNPFADSSDSDDGAEGSAVPVPVTVARSQNPFADCRDALEDAAPPPMASHGYNDLFGGPPIDPGPALPAAAAAHSADSSASGGGAAATRIILGAASAHDRPPTNPFDGEGGGEDDDAPRWC